MAVPSAKPWTPWSYGRAPHPGGTWSPLAGPSRDTTYLLKHLTVHGCLGGRKKREPLLFFPLKQPHTVTRGKCFTLVMIYFCLYQFIVAYLLTFIALGLTSQKDDSLLNIMFSQSVSIQAQCIFLQKEILFLTIFYVSSSFLVAHQEDMPSLL
jgi:hypothetical protein